MNIIHNNIDIIMDIHLLASHFINKIYSIRKIKKDPNNDIHVFFV